MRRRMGQAVSNVSATWRWVLTENILFPPRCIHSGWKENGGGTTASGSSSSTSTPVGLVWVVTDLSYPPPLLHFQLVRQSILHLSWIPQDSLFVEITKRSLCVLVFFTVLVVYQNQVVCYISSEDHPSTAFTLPAQWCTLGSLLE